jgi:hypothetical protein
MKRGHKKRKNKGPSPYIPITGLLVALVLLLWPLTPYSGSAVVYKEARPIKDLKKGLEESRRNYGLEDKTDPFLSYLVRSQQTLNDLEEARKKKLAEEQEEIKGRKLAAAARLKALMEPKTELQKLDIPQLTLTAIIKEKDRSWAMVRDMKGTGYILKKGTHIGKKGGVVEDIVFEARKTPLGKVYTRKVIIQEPYLDKEIDIRYRPIEMEMVDLDYMAEATK